ncbi:oligosaccharide flippase family protein, partial [Streptomyces sp. SID10244]|nr:oligosaccharide flippase family protein [Streptomyces sp. SID10244]
MTASGIGNQVRRGLLWSTASTVVLRGATLLVGIVVARLMSPEEFGVWAVALTVQTVLMTLADLGLSADIVRTPNLRERIPTVATIGLAAGAILTASMAAGSSAIAAALGTPAASSVICVMSFTMVLSGAGVVPF